MTRIASPARRTLWVLATFCAVVIITAFVVVLSRPGQAPLETGTPQAAVQGYTLAYMEERWDEANALSAQPGDRPCNLYHVDSQQGIDLLSVRENGDRATVQVQMNDSYLGGPFATWQGSYEDVFELEREDGAWKVTLAPYPLSMCTAAELGY